MESALLVRIEGRVTGVGFRYYTLQAAAGFPDLCGYVRNVGYGEVEVWLQGPESQVAEMLAWLRHGPSHARVTDVTVSAVTPRSDLVSFTVE